MTRPGQSADESVDRRLLLLTDRQLGEVARLCPHPEDRGYIDAIKYVRTETGASLFAAKAVVDAAIGKHCYTTPEDRSAVLSVVRAQPGIGEVSDHVHVRETVLCDGIEKLTRLPRGAAYPAIVSLLQHGWIAIGLRGNLWPADRATPESIAELLALAEALP